MKKSDVKLFDHTKLRFAIEIEVEFPNSKDSQKLIARHRVLKGWEIDSDMSLDNGAEYRPTNKNHLYWNEESQTQIKEMLALIRVHRGKVTKNCGLHIHIDARKMTSKQILEIIKEFIHKQRFIIKRFHVHKDRIASTCQLLPRENLQKLSVKLIDKYRKDDKVWAFQEYNSLAENKYMALNISHLRKNDYGTLEFRLFDSTLSYRRLKEQILWTLLFIKDAIERE